jgi:hypothetical protein
MTNKQNKQLPGLLAVSKTNPRYFSVEDKTGKERAVYLTGSHIWNNLHDGLGPGPTAPETPEVFDFQKYLDFMKERGHNFIRLWRWEQFQSQANGGVAHLCMSPQPWARTGPGNAKDGKPKFDLEKHNEEFFTRLRERIIRAGEEGMYVAVMFFEGWALHLSPVPDNVEGHPFHANANINDISITSIVDYQTLPLKPRIQTIQETYMKRVVDTVGDLPNVLWEVANESSGQTADQVDMGGGFVIPTPIGDSTEWQYWVMDFVRKYEKEKGFEKHPFGMTFQFPSEDQTKANDPLFKSSADWISPGFDAPITVDPQTGPVPGRYYTDPPVSDGKKVIIADNDHFAPGRGDAIWVWKSFLRGQHPIHMDFGLLAGIDPTNEEFKKYEACRWAMGDTVHYADKMDLINMEPTSELSSTKYALANPGNEYIILQPDGGEFEVDLEPGEYEVEWYNVTTRETTKADKIEVKAKGKKSFKAQFNDPAVLYLKH